MGSGRTCVLAPPFFAQALTRALCCGYGKDRLNYAYDSQKVINNPAGGTATDRVVSCFVGMVSKGGRVWAERQSNVKQEVHNVAVLHDVVFSLAAD